jgi:hypothetical protein
MVARLILLLLLFQYSGTAETSSPGAQDLSSILNKRVTNYNLGPSRLVEALVHVSNDFQIPLGIAWVESPTADAKTPFAWKNATVQEIIDSIVRTQAGYEVRVKNGVVQISPSRDQIADNQNFLKVKLPSFEAHNDFVEMASVKLHMLVTPRKYGQLSIGATGDSRVDLELKNPTVEEALDALAVASDHKIWVVTFIAERGLTPRGMRRTISLWNPKPQPDEEQPGWDLLRWGDPMPPLIASTKQQVP